jgi:beta-lactamase class D
MIFAAYLSVHCLTSYQKASVKLLVGSLIFFGACMPQAKSAVEQPEQLVILADATLGMIRQTFVRRGLNGCFILRDISKDTSLVYNPDRAKQPFLPASTFKIANSLIALECKAVKGINEVIAWDGEERFVAAWNTDHTMRTAIRYSVVWYYQELARRIGESQMDHWVQKLKYGNQTIGPNVDDFWLVGDLRITAEQQVGFLERLIRNDLAAKQKNIDLVKEILVEESNERYTLCGKTGWADFGTPVGWYVGWLDLGANSYIFVLNMDIAEPGEQIYRKEITKEILNELFQIDLGI